ncbi:MAG TPA: hypothetical protein VFG32_08570 [Bacteroidota bacterium]|nr:hypothetical protein [Bacteroidota bacterium]
MDDKSKSVQQKMVFLAQVVSVSLIWVFVIGIGIWIANLISLSLELHDVPGASVGISIVAIPVFFALAGILTYVFIGLQKKHPSSHTSEEK